MDRAVCLATVVEDVGQGRRAAVVAALMLAMGLTACSSPMPPWQPPRTTIQPAPPPMSSPVSQPPVARPSPVVPATPPAGTATEPPRSNVGMANPASEYCLQRGGQLEFSTRANGTEVGTCVSPGGDECEEWAFQRGSCTW